MAAMTSPINKVLKASQVSPLKDSMVSKHKQVRCLVYTHLLSVLSFFGRMAEFILHQLVQPSSDILKRLPDSSAVAVSHIPCQICFQ